MQVSESEIIGIRDLVAHLNAQEDCAVAVEGERDARAMRGIGYDGIILEFHRFAGFAGFADVAAGYGRVVLLFDSDRTGRYMAGRLASMLRRRTRVDTEFRRRLIGITRGRIRFIEQLDCYMPYLG